jgi:hypothetical protein
MTFSHSIPISKPKMSAKRCSSPLRLFGNALSLSPPANKVSRRQRSLPRSRNSSDAGRPRRASCPDGRITPGGRHPNLRTGGGRGSDRRICRHGFRHAARRSHRAKALGDPIPRSGKPQARCAGARDSLESSATGRSVGEWQHRNVRAIARPSLPPDTPSGDNRKTSSSLTGIFHPTWTS